MAVQIMLVTATAVTAGAARPGMPVWLPVAFAGTWMVNLVTSGMARQGTNTSLLAGIGWPVQAVKLIRDYGFMLILIALVITVAPGWTVWVMAGFTLVNGGLTAGSIGHRLIWTPPCSSMHYVNQHRYFIFNVPRGEHRPVNPRCHSIRRSGLTCRTTAAIAVVSTRRVSTPGPGPAPVRRSTVTDAGADPWPESRTATSSGSGQPKARAAGSRCTPGVGGIRGQPGRSWLHASGSRRSRRIPVRSG
jgi:hypothetical protein